MIILKDNTNHILINSLNTNKNGLAYWDEEMILMDEGNSITKLSKVMESKGHQLRYSSIEFSSEFHCSTEPQYVFILQGQMKITLQDGSYKIFVPGQYFYSNDLCPNDEIFDIKKHGHKSENIGDLPLVTLFIKK